jgi:hypothetical protein
MGNSANPTYYLLLTTYYLLPTITVHHSPLPAHALSHLRPHALSRSKLIVQNSLLIHSTVKNIRICLSHKLNIRIFTKSLAYKIHFKCKKM